MINYIEEEFEGVGANSNASDYNLNYVLQMLQSQSHAVSQISGSGEINGDNVPLSVELTHDFQETNLFPDLKERTNINDIGGGTTGLSVAKEGLDVDFETNVSIKMVESGAGYNNTLGIYTIGDDGTINAVEFAFTNVKDGLTDNQIGKAEQNISRNNDRIAKYEQLIETNESRIEKLAINIENYGTKKAELLESGDPGVDHKIAKIENNINKLEARINNYEGRISQYESKIAIYKTNIETLNDDITNLKAQQNFSYTIDSQNGTELGLFIVADGDRKNSSYQDLDFENGELQFIYHLGQSDERQAKITDSAADISLVHAHEGTITVLKGNIFHSTERGSSTDINPDNAEHAVSGLIDSEDGSTLRVGFEDLKNLGDADFNDVVFDMTIDKQTVYLPIEMLNDIIHGSEFNDTIDAGKGDDTVHAGAGNDTVEGGDGNDEIYGDIGYDLLRGGGGNDSIHGGDWKDVLVGNLGNDKLYGDAGDDTLYGNEGDDELWGGDHNDTLNGNQGDDKLYGEAGDDTLQGESGQDIISGGLGNDYIDGGADDDTIDGGDGDDRLYGGVGNDTIEGGLGNDIIYGNDGNDIITSGDGNDEVIGGLGNDIISTGNGDDRAFGNEGDDIINGGMDKDVLYGDEGNDTISGGGGDDQIVGGTGNDILNGNGGKDYLYGEDGDDFIFLGEGADVARGGSGADTFVIEETASRDSDMMYAMDFDEKSGDRINISDLLSNFNAGTDDINDFVFVTQGYNTTIQIDRDGAGSEFGVDNVLRLQGNTTLDTNVQTLIEDGTLMI